MIAALFEGMLSRIAPLVEGMLPMKVSLAEGMLPMIAALVEGMLPVSAARKMSKSKAKTSAPIGAWMCNFPPFRKLWQTDRPTNYNSNNPYPFKPFSGKILGAILVAIWENVYMNISVK